MASYHSSLIKGGLMLNREQVCMVVGFTISFFDSPSEILHKEYEMFCDEIADDKSQLIYAPFIYAINDFMVFLLILEYRKTDNGQVFGIITDSDDTIDAVIDWQKEISREFSNYPCKFIYRNIKKEKSKSSEEREESLQLYLRKSREIFTIDQIKTPTKK